MAFLIAPLIAGLVGLLAGSAMTPKAKPLPPPKPPPDTPIKPSMTAAAERARRSMPRGAGGVAGLILSPLGGTGDAAAPRKSLLGG